jgi:toxin HigB-1
MEEKNNIKASGNGGTSGRRITARVVRRAASAPGRLDEKTESLWWSADRTFRMRYTLALAVVCALLFFVFWIIRLAFLANFLSRVDFIPGLGAEVFTSQARRMLAAPPLLTLITRIVIIAGVIRSFRDKDTQGLFMREPIRRWSQPVQRAGLRKLLILDAATSMEDLRLPPGNRLEKLSGERSEQYSLRINDRWRVCFGWVEGDAINVEIVDYH